jgi:aminobenzoyl-glutamate transport protein
VAARSLLTTEGIRFIYTSVIPNFMSFTAVGLIIVAMIGVGVAESSGLIQALIRKLVAVSPGWAIAYILVFVGIVSSIAADAGYLVLIPWPDPRFSAWAATRWPAWLRASPPWPPPSRSTC